MLPEERLNDLAAREIADLEADGIYPTAAEVVRLNALGWAIEYPTARRELSRGVPIMLCEGVYLWPLTIQATDWFDRVGEHLEPTALDMILHPRLSADLPLLALAYAMANAYADGSALDTDGPDATRAILSWSSGLKCTADRLQCAIAEVVAQQDTPTLPPEDDGRPMAVGDFSVHLAAACGETPDFWERRCSIGYCAALLSAITKQAIADGRPLANDPKILATRAMGLEAARIRKAHAETLDGK